MKRSNDSSSGRALPDARGHFGVFGGRYVAETLMPALLARRLRKTRLIAETGAGQHGVATATVAALFDMRCEVFMGAEDVQRQSLNVFRMKLLGADVRVVESGSQ